MRPTLKVNDLFGTRGRVDVLRALWDVEIPMTAAEVARRTHLTHPAAVAALRGLEALGVLASAPAGRGSTYWMNRENAYVKGMLNPVFTAEQDMPDDMLQVLRQTLAARTVSVLLFGSYARGDQTIESDVDVIAVAQDADKKSSLEAERAAIAMEFRRQYGSSLSLIVYSPVEAAELPERSPALWESLTDEAVLISGVGASEWSRLAKG